MNIKSICLSAIFFLFILQQGNTLTVSLDAGVFNSPHGSYLELSIYIYGASLSNAYYGDPAPLRGVSALMTIQQGENYIKADKFNLISPTDSSTINFMDIKRYPLAIGEYTLKLVFTDLKDSTNTITEERQIIVSENSTDVRFSTLHLLANVMNSDTEDHLSKNGVYMEQLPFNFYHEDLNKLHFYAEIYNLKNLEDQRFFITYSILTNGQKIKEVKKGHKLLKSFGEVIPVLVSFDITDLKSGNYKLRLSVHQSDKSELAFQEKSFQRSNPEADANAYNNVNTTDFDDSFVADLALADLRYSLKAIAPIVPPSDVEVINILVEKEELKSMRFYLNRYWKSQSLADPKAAYDAYMEVAGAIDKMYNSGFGHGFETDRGFIYLKYGKPDDIITVIDEPSASPYEIWIYNSLQNLSQSHVKFLFYNPTLADGAYELLHSNAIGERQNPRWEVLLYGSSQSEVDGNDPVRSTNMLDNFGRNARRLFEEN